MYNEEKYYYIQWMHWWVTAVVVLSLIPLFFIETNIDIKNYTGFILVLSILFLPVVLVPFIHLNVTITTNSITFSMFHFHFKKVNYSSKDISLLRLVKYSPIRDFGGWGIRYSSKGEKAFTVQGKFALCIKINKKTRYICIKDIVSAHRFLSKHYANKYVVDESIKNLIVGENLK